MRMNLVVPPRPLVVAGLFLLCITAVRVLQLHYYATIGSEYTSSYYEIPSSSSSMLFFVGNNAAKSNNQLNEKFSGGRRGTTTRLSSTLLSGVVETNKNHTTTTRDFVHSPSNENNDKKALYNNTGSESDGTNHTRITRCFTWQQEMEADAWWTHHPMYIMDTENDTLACYRYDPSLTYYKEIYENQFHHPSGCGAGDDDDQSKNNTVVTRFLWESG